MKPAFRSDVTFSVRLWALEPIGVNRGDRDQLGGASPNGTSRFFVLPPGTPATRHRRCPFSPSPASQAALPVPLHLPVTSPLSSSGPLLLSLETFSPRPRSPTPDRAPPAPPDHLRSQKKRDKFYRRRTAQHVTTAKRLSRPEFATPPPWDGVGCWHEAAEAVGVGGAPGGNPGT